MTNIVVMSDSHGNMRRIESIKNILEECDLIVHLGDSSGDAMSIIHMFPHKTIIINGNCDRFPCGENERVIEADGVKFFATHGHLYSAKSTLYRLCNRARELGCSHVLYGHTHTAREDFLNGVTLLNPGNMSKYSANSYLYLSVNDGKAVSKIVRF